MIIPISPDEANSALGTGRETFELEFKGGFMWGDASALDLQERTIRAMLAMSHNERGGVIVVGIDEGPNHEPRLTGVNTEQIQSFTDTERIEGNVSRYTDVPLNFEIRLGESSAFGQDSVQLLFIYVETFTRYPIHCREDGRVLREGGRAPKHLVEHMIYHRPKTGRPRSVVADQLGRQEIYELMVLRSGEILRRLTTGSIQNEDPRSLRNEDM